MRRVVDRSQRAAAAEKADAVLIAEMHLPESDALAALFRRYIRLVHRVAANILRDDAEAEDVTQEVFLEIYRKAHLYDPSRGAVRVWLLQYAYRRSVQRKNVLRRRAAYRGEPLDGVDPTPRGRPRALTGEECRWFIRRGLAQLTAPQRATLELACLEDVSLQDVAKRLCVSVGCARHYYYRGLARLRAWAQAGLVLPDAERSGPSPTTGAEDPRRPSPAPAARRRTPEPRAGEHSRIKPAHGRQATRRPRDV
jgi:RNA polymerase sigma-70 factor (ECF subfamily)